MSKKKKAESKVKVMKWLGTWPANCDLCKCDLNDQASSVDEHEVPNGYFVDGVTKFFNKWGLMCPSCFEEFGVGLGKGKGQKYAVPSLVKIAG